MHPTHVRGSSQVITTTSRHLRAGVLSAGIGFALASLIFGCGAGSIHDGGEDLVDPAREDGGGDGSGGFGGGGGGIDVGGGGGGGFDVAGGGDIGGGPTDTSCASTSSAATLIPLDLFIMQDQSGSMRETTSTGATKWEAVKAALKSFMDDPTSAGIGVGIQYFGIEVASGPFGTKRSSCVAADYAKAEVEIAPLPGVEASILSSLAAHSPSTDTPTGVALQGAVDHAHAWQAAHPTHMVAVVLATDGLPTACSPQDIPGISAIASGAAAGKPAIHTYVIGVLSDTDLATGADGNLNSISKAGNGADAFIVKSTSTDVAKAFSDALKKIRGSALACQYTVPTGVGADYNKVNVVVTSGGASTTIPYVVNAAGCDPTKGGWYYDVPPGTGTPTKILMCDATCKTLSADASGKINIAVGCATVGPK